MRQQLVEPATDGAGSSAPPPVARCRHGAARRYGPPGSRLDRKEAAAAPDGGTALARRPSRRPRAARPVRPTAPAGPSNALSRAGGYRTFSGGRAEAISGILLERCITCALHPAKELVRNSDGRHGCVNRARVTAVRRYSTRRPAHRPRMRSVRSRAEHRGFPEVTGYGGQKLSAIAPTVSAPWRKAGAPTRVVPRGCGRST